MKLDSISHSNITYTPIEKKIFDGAKKTHFAGSIFSSLGTVARQIPEIINNVSKNVVVKEIFQVQNLKVMAAFFKQNEKLFNSTKYLKSFTLLQSLPTLYKSVKKISLGSTDLSPLLKIVRSVGSIITTIHDIVSIAIRVSKTVLKIFAALGFVQNIIDCILDIKKLEKYQTRLNHFVKSVDYRKKGTYTVEHYKKLCKFIYQTETTTLAKQLGVDNKSFEKNIILKLKKIQPIDNKFSVEQQKKLSNLMDLFKNRLESKKKSYVVVLITDAINLIGNALIIASVTQPYIIPIWLTFNISTLAIKYMIDTVKTYRFEHKMGMIQRNKYQSKTSFKDFFKWYFNLYNKSVFGNKPTANLSIRLKDTPIYCA